MRACRSIKPSKVAFHSDHFLNTIALERSAAPLCSILYFYRRVYAYVCVCLLLCKCVYIFQLFAYLCAFCCLFINEVIQLERVLPHGLQSAVSSCVSVVVLLSLLLLLLLLLLLFSLLMTSATRRRSAFCICIAHFALQLFVPFLLYSSTLLIFINTNTSERVRERERWTNVIAVNW